MNGPQDVGGMTTFGPVAPETDEPVFHAEWERRALALSVAVAASGRWTIDSVRHARESLTPARYWSSSYYEIRTEGMIAQLIEAGMLNEEELSSGRALLAPIALPRVLAARDVAAVLSRGWPADRMPAAPARFQVGDPVRARNLHVLDHTRLPMYVRGRLGEIARVHGAHVFPDSSAQGSGEDPRWLYNVRFATDELWGGDRNGAVHLDLWEPYLEPIR
jgi:nitrile hydratase